MRFGPGSGVRGVLGHPATLVLLSWPGSSPCSPIEFRLPRPDQNRTGLSIRQGARGQPDRRGPAPGKVQSLFGKGWVRPLCGP